MGNTGNLLTLHPRYGKTWLRGKVMLFPKVTENVKCFGNYYKINLKSQGSMVNFSLKIFSYLRKIIDFSFKMGKILYLLCYLFCLTIKQFLLIQKIMPLEKLLIISDFGRGIFLLVFVSWIIYSHISFVISKFSDFIQFLMGN